MSCNPLREFGLATALGEFLQLPLKLMCQVVVMGRMRRPYAFWTDIAEGFHRDAVKLAKQPADLCVSGIELLRSQGLFQLPQSRTVELAHENEVEPYQPL